MDKRQEIVEVIVKQIGDKLEYIKDGVVIEQGMSFTDAIEATLNDLAVLGVMDYQALMADAVISAIVVHGLFDFRFIELDWDAAS
jgi:hypothetical protein